MAIYRALAHIVWIEVGRLGGRVGLLGKDGRAGAVLYSIVDRSGIRGRTDLEQCPRPIPGNIVELDPSTGLCFRSGRVSLLRREVFFHESTGIPGCKWTEDDPERTQMLGQSG